MRDLTCQPEWVQTVIPDILRGTIGVLGVVRTLYLDYDRMKTVFDVLAGYHTSSKNRVNLEQD